LDFDLYKNFEFGKIIWYFCFLWPTTPSLGKWCQTSKESLQGWEAFYLIFCIYCHIVLCPLSPPPPIPFFFFFFKNFIVL
jgi:hypothetical protein